MWWVRKPQPVRLSDALDKWVEKQNYHLAFFISPPPCVLGEIRKEFIITCMDVKNIKMRCSSSSSGQTLRFGDNQQPVVIAKMVH